MKMLMACIMAGATGLALLVAPAPPAAAYPASTFEWTLQQSGVDVELFDVSALDPSHAWAVGASGMILFYDGSTWTPQASGLSEAIESVSAVDPSHVWAVSVLGNALFFDGHSWEVQDPQPEIADKNYLYGVHALDAQHVWAVGLHGTVCFFDGFDWSAQQRAGGVDTTLTSVFAADAGHVWAVGEQGTVLFNGGGGWVTQASGTDQHLYGVTATDGVHAWACGWNGTILEYRGRGWRAVDSGGVSDVFRGISAADQNHVWAVTDYGTIDFYNGGTWTPSRGPADHFEGVSAADPKLAWAVGSSGAIAIGQAVGAVRTSRTWGHDSIGVTQPQTTWYLAEGCTAYGFETWVLVQNPNPGEAHVDLTYMTADGPRNGPSVNLAASSRMTFNVAETVPGSSQVSTKVQANMPVIAERAMYGNGRQWGHDSIGASETATKWYLAEGCTADGFETWVLVQNPGAQWAQVAVTYMTASGAVPGPVTIVPPGSRKTFNVADTVPGSWQVSTLVSSDKPVVAERAMYGNNRAWGHDSIGVSRPANSWYLAEGCTGMGFETWVLVQNPGNAGAEVNLTFMTPAGLVEGPSAVLQAHTRKTFNVADTVPGAWQISTRVDSNKPVIAERAMYGNGRTWAHDSIGTAAPATDWYLAEGCTAAGFETWVLVQNPNGVAVEVTLTFMTDTGPVPGPSSVLPPNSRMTFNVWETTGARSEVSTAVHAAGGGVIAERAMYGDPR